MVFIPKPVLHLKMKGNADDSSGYDNHGIVTDVILTDDKWGNPNSAYDFNGTSAFINYGNHSSLNTNNLSISIWVKPDVITDVRGIIGKRDVNSDDKKSFLIFQNSKSINYKTYTSSEVDTTISNVFSINEWIHIIATYDGANQKLYTNGNLIGSNSQTGNIQTTTTNLLIGAYYNITPVYFFGGIISDAIIYSVALTPTQVAYLYDKTKRNYGR